MRSNDEHDPWNGLRTVCISGCLVLAAFVAMFALSGSFEYGSGEPRPVTIIVGILMTAAVAAFVGLGAAIKVPAQRQRQLLLVIVGLAVSMRLVALLTCPILEIDYYRYIWDGKVLAEGISPYEYSPKQVLGATPDSVDPTGQMSNLGRLALLSWESESNLTIVQRIHYGRYSSIYPPISQCVFAATMKWFPSSSSVKAHILAIKFALVLFDLATMALVYWLICSIGKHPGWLIVYAWNPLVVKEIANGGHLDSIAAFFLTLSVLVVVRWRLRCKDPQQPALGSLLPACSGVALGLGVGAKLFPIVLFPALMVFIARQSWNKAGLFVVSFLIVATASLWSMIDLPDNRVAVTKDSTESAASIESDSAALTDSSSSSKTSSNPDKKNGLVGFLSEWRMNAPVFSTVYLNLKSTKQAASERPWFVVSSHDWRNRLYQWCKTNGVGGDDPAFMAARILTLGVFACFYLWQLVMIYQFKPAVSIKRPDVALPSLTYSYDHDPQSSIVFLKRIVMVLALFLLLQPTVNPWYLVWIVPLASLTSHRGWLLVSGILMAYYCRFWLKSLSGTFAFWGCNFTGVGLFDHLLTFVEFALIACVFCWSVFRENRQLQNANDIAS